MPIDKIIHVVYGYKVPYDTVLHERQTFHNLQHRINMKNIHPIQSNYT